MRKPLPPRIKKTEDGKYPYVLEWRDAQGKRHRRFFTNKVKAEAECRKLINQLEEAGKGALSLRPGDAEMLAEIKKLLEPFGVDPLTVVRDWVEKRKRELSSVSVEEAVTHFLEAKTIEGLRPRALQDLKNRLNRFKQDFSGRILSSLTPQEIYLWILNLPVAPQTKVNFRRVISNLLNWSAMQGWCPEDIIKKVPNLKVRPAKTEIFSIEEIKILLEAARKEIPDLVSYLALGFFCGLRTAELDRLQWSQVNHKEVVIDAGVAKTASRRVVPL